MPGIVATETFRTAQELFGVQGALILAVAELQDGMLSVQVIDLIANKTISNPGQGQSLGKNHLAIVSTRMARRVRTVLTPDTSQDLRMGEMRIEGDASQAVDGKLYLAAFSGDTTLATEQVIANFALELLLRQEMSGIKY